MGQMKKIIWSKCGCMALLCVVVVSYIAIEAVLDRYNMLDLTKEELKQAFVKRKITLQEENLAIEGISNGGGARASVDTSENSNETYLKMVLPEYGAYQERNQRHINRVKEILSDPSIPWLKEKRYVCGIDFAPGEYLAMTIEENGSGYLRIIRDQGNKVGHYIETKKNQYFTLNTGDSITLTGIAIAPAEEVPKAAENKREWLNDPAIHWLKAKSYVCGVDFAPGEYGARKIREDSEGSIKIHRPKVKKLEFASEYVSFELNRFFSVEVGDRIDLENAAIAPEAEIPNLAEADGILYEGGYRVGKEINHGEYFTLSMVRGGRMFYSIAKEEREIHSEEGFGYADIKPPIKAVMLEGGIAFPIALKPKILSLSQEPLILYSGIYLVGRDIPEGRYYFGFGELDIPDKQEYELHWGYEVSNDPAFPRTETEKGDFARNGKRTILRKTIWVEHYGEIEESVSYRYRWPEDKVYIDVRDGQYLNIATGFQYGGETPQ